MKVNYFNASNCIKPNQKWRSNTAEKTIFSLTSGSVTSPIHQGAIGGLGDSFQRASTSPSTSKMAHAQAKVWMRLWLWNKTSRIPSNQVILRCFSANTWLAPGTAQRTSVPAGASSSLAPQDHNLFLHNGNTQRTYLLITKMTIRGNNEQVTKFPGLIRLPAAQPLEFFPQPV